MNDAKAFFQSKTIWGALVVVASTAARIAGYEVGDTGAWVDAIGNLIGAAMVVWGRVTAVKKIDRVI